MNPNNQVHVNIEFLKDKYPKFKIYTSELTLNICEYKPPAHVTMQSMILP
jgi:hypothetical protein